jgi:hypothetical protein
MDQQDPGNRFDTSHEILRGDLPSDQNDQRRCNTASIRDEPTQATYMDLHKRVYSTAFEKLVLRPRIRRTEKSDRNPTL